MRSAEGLILNKMNKYRVSGFVDEVGAVQADICAKNVKNCRKIAEEEHGFYEIVNVSLMARNVKSEQP